MYKANQVRNYMITDFCDNINELDAHLADKLELFNEKYTALLPVKKRLKRFAKYINLKIWCFIFIVSICCIINSEIINTLGVLLMQSKIYKKLKN